MRIIILQIFILAFLSSSIFAQNDDSQVILYNEQTNMPLNSVLAYTSGLALEVSKNKDLKILVNIYGNNDYFAAPYLAKAYISSNLINNYNLSGDKFLVQNCSVNQKDLRIQIFQVPQNVKFEACEENLIVPARSVHFETLFFEPEENKLYVMAIEDAVVDLNTPGSYYSKMSLAVLLHLLNRSPESRIYLVAYLGTNLHGIASNDDSGESILKDVRNIDKRHQAKKILNNITSILNKNGIESSRIETIKGGYREGQKHVEIWFVPKAGEIPKPAPNYVRRLKGNK